MSVADAMREPPAAPAMTGGSFPEGGEVRLCGSAALCHLACHEEMASGLVVGEVNAGTDSRDRDLGRAPFDGNAVVV